MKSRGFALCAVAGAALLGLAACGEDDSTSKSTPSPAATTSGSASPAVSPAASKPAELKDVKLGYTPILINSPFYVGIEKWYFAAEAINLKLEFPGGSGTDILTQVIAGNIQAGSSGLAAAPFNAVSASLKDKKDIPFEVVAPLHNERPPSNTPLVVSKARMDSGEITKVSADVIKRAPRPHFDPTGQLVPEEWRASEAYFRSAGHLTYEGSPDLNLSMRLK